MYTDEGNTPAYKSELAWAAGFFDGEGHTGMRVPTGRDYGYVVMNMAQTEREPLERFQAAVGAGYIYGPYGRKNHKHRPVWKWQANGWDARRVLAQLSEYLSRPKYEQAVTVSLAATYGRIDPAKCA